MDIKYQAPQTEVVENAISGILCESLPGTGFEEIGGEENLDW